MIGSIKYEDMQKYSNILADSSKKLREIILKYNSEDLNGVLEFCEMIDSYSRFLSSSIELYKDSDEALKTIIEKSK